MIRSFLLITFRILWRNKVTSFVNIFSLSVGITAFIFITLYVRHETSYDKFNKNYEFIYRLEGDQYAKLPPLIGAYVQERLPEVQDIARFSGGYAANSAVSYVPENNPQDIKQVEANFYWADSTIFNVFSFSFIAGNSRTALKEPMTAVLTESTARKLFGETNPLTKTIEFRDHPYTVTGIVSDIHNSHIEIDVLFSMESIARVYPDRNLNDTGPNSWLWSATYLLMKGGIDKTLVEEKINKVLSEINDGNLFDLQFKRFHIRPLRDIYFHGALQNLPYGIHGNLKLIQVLIAVALFTLVLAGINYVNLTTARSVIRAKEVAVKRISGSSANLLRYQLIVESVIVSFISLVVAITIMQFFLSRFNQLAMVNIQVNELNRPIVWLGILAGGSVIGILAGVYPAFYLTAIQPVSLIKGQATKGSPGSNFRNWLMTFQFALSIVMIVSIIVNFRQLHYLRNADLGFSKEQVLRINTPADIPDVAEQRNTFKERLLQHHSIRKVSFSAGVPGGPVPTGIFEIEGVKRASRFFLIDQDYFDLMGIKLSEGRAFSLDRPGDMAGSGSVSIVLNESAVREFGLVDAVGTKIAFDPVGQAEVIGIVKDFHFQSLHHKIEPLLFAWTQPMHVANIKIASSDLPASLKIIETEWKKVWGQKFFSYEFLDDSFAKQYNNDEQLAMTIQYFTGLAVIIACLGLFAMSSFMISRRTKEIGVRKTLGASIGTIYAMLSWDFLKWVVVAIIIATPVSWYLMNRWLQTFAYQIATSADIFVTAALLAVTIALTTVTWQSLNAAFANPVKALRYE